MEKRLTIEELKQAKINRERINQEFKKTIKNCNTSIISCNCIGGIIYHDLGLKFLSPTINLFFTVEDFYKFVSNLDYYLSIEPTEYPSEYNYPIMLLDDIKLFCRHYNSFIEASEAWNRRKQRITNNIFIIATDQNHEQLETLRKIDNLSYRKIIFTCNEQLASELENGVYIPGYIKEVGHLDRFIDESGYRVYEKYFDVSTIFN